MKRNYIRIILFDIFVVLCMLFAHSFLTSNRYIYLLGVSVFFVLFYFIFGFERDRHRHVFDSIFDMIIYLFVFLIVYYLFGIVVGFARSATYTFSQILSQLLPFFLYVIVRELFRYMVVCKSQEKMFMLVIEIAFFTFLDLFSPFYSFRIASSYLLLIYFSTILAPVVINGMVFSYLDYEVGYKPVLFYALFVEIFRIFVPIIPNPSIYVQSVIFILLPFFLGYKQYRLFHKKSDEEITRNHKKNKFSIRKIAIFACTVMFIVYFVSGYFRYWAIVIATGSMEDTIHVGDAVIIDQSNKNIEIGQIAAYRYQDTLIVHRVVDKVLVGDQYFYTTKGDNNDNVDSFLVDSSMIVGSVSYKIPYIGIPTVWFHQFGKS